MWGGIAASAVLHLLAVWLGNAWWTESRQSEAFRARLALKPRFEPERLGAVRPEALPAPEMAYLLPEVVPPRADAADAGTAEPAPLVVDATAAPTTAAIARPPAMRADTVTVTSQRLPSPADYGWEILADGETAMDLLRMPDLADADAYRAAIVVDATGRRETRGFINFTRLNLYGAGAGRRGELDAVARYLRDYTGLYAQVRPEQHHHFLSETLLKDPVHFLIQGGGMPASQDEVLVNFSDAEKALLARYLTGGGFLFVEADGESTDGYRYLAQVVAVLREVIGEQGRLLPIPVTHPLYHSYFDFDSGFPGEYHKEKIPDYASWGGNTWYYPGSDRPGRTPPAAVGDSRFLRRLAGVQAPEVEQLPLVGLYGAEIDGRLVAVISDLNLHRHWPGNPDADQEEESTSGPFLTASVNIITYALQRPDGLAVRRAPPAWKRQRPDEPSPRSDPVAATGAGDWIDAEMLQTLDASLAIVRSPFGAAIPAAGLRLRLDDQPAIDSTAAAANGLLLHNLSAGAHSLELGYEGRTRSLEVVLEGGKVSTVTFALNRVVVFSRLTMKQQRERVAVDEWLASFADLAIEERFLDRLWTP